MAEEKQPWESLFDEVPRHRLPTQDALKAFRLVEAGDVESVFPAGSAAPPALLVGREPHIERLKAYGRSLLDPAVKGAGPLIGLLLHGPRGTGKTVLLNTFAQEVEKAGALIVAIDGGSLQSVGAAVGAIGWHGRPPPDETVSQGAAAEGGVPGIAKGELSAGRQDSRAGRLLGDHDIGSAIRSLFQGRDAKARRPALITCDEVHSADPNVVGQLMNAVQTAAGRGWPVGFALAGTPDALDVLRAAGATWFLDRETDQRLVGVGNLSEDDCHRCVSVPLAAAGVDVDGELLKEAAGQCHGSPYFTQALGKSILEERSDRGVRDGFRWRVDLSPEAPAMTRYRNLVEGRYNEAWETLDAKGLTGCARQLGALWRWSHSARRPALNALLANAAVRSGLEHGPAIGEKPELAEAQREFRHLGLLWAPSGLHGQWEMGLPSFFAYVEGIYQDTRNPDHHQTLAALDRDLARLAPDAAPALGEEPENDAQEGAPGDRPATNQPNK